MAKKGKALVSLGKVDNFEILVDKLNFIVRKANDAGRIVSEHYFITLTQCVEDILEEYPLEHPPILNELKKFVDEFEVFKAKLVEVCKNIEDKWEKTPQHEQKGTQ